MGTSSLVSFSRVHANLKAYTFSNMWMNCGDSRLVEFDKKNSSRRPGILRISSRIELIMHRPALKCQSNNHINYKLVFEQTSFYTLLRTATFIMVLSPVVFSNVMCPGESVSLSNCVVRKSTSLVLQWRIRQNHVWSKTHRCICSTDKRFGVGKGNTELEVGHWSVPSFSELESPPSYTQGTLWH